MLLKFDSTVCRICLQTGASVNIFNNKEYTQKFQYCTELQIAVNDGLPQSLCINCLSRLNSASDFKRQCISADEYLRTFISTINTKFTEVAALAQNKDSNIVLPDKSTDASSVNATVTNPVIVGSIAILPKNSVIDSNSHIKIEYVNINETKSNPGQVNNIGSDEQEIQTLSVNDSDSKSEQVVEFVDIIQSQNYNETNNQHELLFEEEEKHIGEEDEWLSKDNNDRANPNIIANSNSNDENFDDLILIDKVNRRKLSPKEDAAAISSRSTNESHYCVECHKTFVTKSNLMRHVLIHRGTKPYSCTHCEASFTQNGSLRQHMLRHSGLKPHVCNMCGKGFTRKRILTMHIRTHTGEKPFQCNECGLKFAVKNGLTQHQATKHLNIPKKDYICNICNKILRSKYSLQMHTIKHENGSLHKYECDICQKVCIGQASLQIHQLEHSMTKSHDCKICSQSFFNKKTLARHIKIHKTAKQVNGLPD